MSISLPLNGYSGLAAMTSDNGDVIAVSNAVHNTITIFSPTCEQTFGIYGKGPYEFAAPARLCFTHTGSLLVAEHENKRIQEIAIDTVNGHLTHIRNIDVGIEIFAITMCKDTIIVGKRDDDNTDGRIVVIDYGTGEIRHSFTKFEDIGAVMGLAYSDAHGILCADLHGSKITKYTIDGICTDTLYMPDNANFVDVCTFKDTFFAIDVFNKRIICDEYGEALECVPIGLAASDTKLYILATSDTEPLSTSIHVFTP
jgi:hypothetical protein